ncbi:MAG: hypothetical protein E7L40_04545 [Corynebacterium kroppenstedtii]|uniref:hypothetical protein n=1 Tax=Corynebacterium kroppenstedtii TaxID=161879 RepID=UPI0026E96FEA|nr:hypothetical protein [Corynebacterium kroppenstedtii]MDU7286863.1 hypothetical protein [Corynebacterium kroppenstedtii]
MSTTPTSKVHFRTTLAAIATALPLGMANAEAEPPTPDTSFGPKTTFVEWQAFARPPRPDRPLQP